jgi:hypothetical protein
MKMKQYEIIIEYTDHDKFKEGIHNIRKQAVHIQSQITELEKNRDLLIDTQEEVINHYCDPNNDLCYSKVWIPKHIAKMEYYPCYETERIHAFMKEMEFDVTITLNGCYKFIRY